MKALIFLASLCLTTLCFAQKYDDDMPLAHKAQRDQIDRSIQDYTKAIAGDPANPKNYYQRGVAELLRSSFEQQPMEDRGIDPEFGRYRNAAIADLTKSIEFGPENSEAFDQRGMAKEGYQADSQADFDKAIQIDPKNANAYLHKGLSDGNFRPDSIDNLTTAISLDPTCAAAYFYRAEAKQRMKDFEGTIDDLSKCIALNPEMVMPYRLRAYSELEKGDLAAAEADLKKVTELRPGEAYWWEQLATIKAHEHDFDKAISDLNRAIKLDPHRDIYFLERGDAKRLRGDYQAALDDYRITLNFSPEINEEVSIRLGIWECETKLGGHSIANTHLSHYLKTLHGSYNSWTISIGRFLLDESDEKSFLSDATKMGHADQAQYYIQMKKAADS